MLRLRLLTPQAVHAHDPPIRGGSLSDAETAIGASSVVLGDAGTRLSETEATDGQ